MAEKNRLVQVSFWVEGMSEEALRGQLGALLGQLSAHAVRLEIKDAPWQGAPSQKTMQKLAEPLSIITDSLAGGRSHSVKKTLREEAGVSTVRDLYIWGKSRARILRGIGSGKVLSGLESALAYACPDMAWYDRPTAAQIARFCPEASVLPLFAVDAEDSYLPHITITEFQQQPTAGGYKRDRIQEKVDSFLRQHAIARREMR